MEVQKNNDLSMAQAQRKYVNKTLTICYSVAVAIGMLGYISSIASEPQPLIQVIIWISACLVPYVVNDIVYFAKKDSEKVKYFMAIGYLIFYVTQMIIEKSTIYNFVYIFPVLIVLIVCNNQKLIYLIGGVTVLINVYDLIDSSSLVSESENLSRIAMVVICVAFAVLTSHVSNKITKGQLSAIEDEKKASDEMLRVINDETLKMGEAITNLNSNKDTLSESITSTAEVVAGISGGMNDAVNSIQQQLTATENIKKLVEEAKSQVLKVDELTRETKNSVTDGASKISELSESTDVMQEKNSVILEEVNELEAKADEVKQIVDMINNIASQTRLLSLNASIEAARAGEHGKGFAVVAGEINELSSKTSDSIQSITEIIDILNGEINSMKSAIDDMVNANNNQNDVINQVSSSITMIKEGIEGVDSNMTILSDQIGDVSTHTDAIVSDAANLSAVSEEVLASTNEADGICAKNQTIVNTISGISNMLKEGADNLKKRDSQNA